MKMYDFQILSCSFVQLVHWYYYQDLIVGVAMKLYDRKLSWKIFCLIGQGRTLSHAAQECGIDLPYASRLISKLEDELGFFLVLHRPQPDETQ